MGYNDLTCYGSKKIKSPNLDRLASEGKRFTNFMVASSVCSPSRAARLTGCYPKRVSLEKHVLFPQSKKGIHPDEYTLADHFSSAGYATTAIGKWHLGHYPETLPSATNSSTTRRGANSSTSAKTDGKLLNSSSKNKKRKPMLFHLAEDIGEKNDLASKQPERTKAMTTSMRELDNVIEENRRPAWTTDKPHPWPKDIN